MAALVFELGPKTRHLLEQNFADLVQSLRDLVDVTKSSQDRSTFENGGIMFIVADDNPDVTYSITPPNATDSEGNPIPGATLTYDATSSDPAVVAITPDADPTTGSVHFGNPGQASLNVNVLSGGVLLGAFGAQFTVTLGAVAAITGGSIGFNGLTES